MKKSGRELHIKEFVRANTAFFNSLPAEQTDNTPIPAGHEEMQYPPWTPEENAQVVLFMHTDLTNIRKQIEQAHQQWIAALDVVNDPIFLHDKNCRILRCNKAYQQRAGLPFKQIIGRIYFEIFPKMDSPPRSCLQAMESTAMEEEEITIGESIYRSRSSSIRDAQGTYLQSVHILEDITEHKRIEASLRNSEEQYRTIIENSNDMIWALSADGRFTFINKQAADATGRSIDDWLGKSFEPLVLEEDLPMALEMHGKLMHGEKVHYEVRSKKADGSVLTMAVNASPVIKNGTVSGTICFAKNITEIKRTEVAIQHANRALATLSGVNRTLVHATNEEELLQSICQVIVEQRGYRLAWVGYAQHDADKSIKIMAHASIDDQGLPDTMKPTWSEHGDDMGPSGRAICTGTTQVCQDIPSDAHYSPWRNAAIQRGYMASIALPLRDMDETVFGTLTVYAGEVDAFTPAEIDLLEEMAGDLAFGVRTLHIRLERDLAQYKVRQQLTQLQDNLGDTVQAMAAIVEMRDPYTSGHQLRVANLAVAIARQMQLPDDQVNAIHLAGILHDLGKIQIPSEILSKPGKISDAEFGLIKGHPQAGHDILKGINFPWPIARMVLQHHERMDGSGYPQGQKGDDILLEARILSVADVVEAIAAHRPYRPGLGIDAALAEITKQRGIYFDPAVVDACLALFRERNYSL